MKENYCNAAGECTCTNSDEERNCLHGEEPEFLNMPGSCILRSGCGDCLSAPAKEEAKIREKSACRYAPLMR